MAEHSHVNIYGSIVEWNYPETAVAQVGRYQAIFGAGYPQDFVLAENSQDV
ncbi:hypothetical protein [Luteibacter sp. 22Crub2.1]|uniref:hypothetical protein n=1 Tax=Luteibacter sp. 22Crub2.1 TaxID=1283288 RepID=UPI001591E746|nr:hypothetical protein [Luteibacter sp. 22Crub2.1]